MLRIITRCVQAVSVRPLSAVTSLVRFAEEPQMFAIEFNDGCPIHVRFIIFSLTYCFT
jgi:DnaJ family protein C protein 13